MADQGRRIPDRAVLLALLLAVVVLLVVTVVAVLSYRNPDVTPLDLPTAASA